MTANHQEEKSVIKTSVASSLKVQFKLLCVQNELTISDMLERLIHDLVESEREIPSNLPSPLQEIKVVKGYIPSSLKREFKLFCTQKQIPMNLVLSYLIRTWVEETIRSRREGSGR